jgi:hypothetical protein
MILTFLGFVHRLNIIKSQRFGSWILLPSSGKKGGGQNEGYLLGQPQTWTNKAVSTVNVSQR